MTPPTSLVCFGDSLTEEWANCLQQILDQTRPGDFLVHNRGVAGNTSAQGLDRIGEGVLPLLPGRVVIAFGINDCNVRPDRRTARVGVDEFASNLCEIVRMIRAADGVPVLLAAHYPGSDQRDAATRKYDQGNGSTYADNFRPYHLTVRRVTAECGTPLIDIPEQILCSRAEAAELLTEDGVHLTTQGVQFYAEQVCQHLST